MKKNRPLYTPGCSRTTPPRLEHPPRQTPCCALVSRARTTSRTAPLVARGVAGKPLSAFLVAGSQMKYLGELIAKYGEDGCADITTRQNIQLRGVQLPDVPEIFETLDGFGITCKQVAKNPMVPLALRSPPLNVQPNPPPPAHARCLHWNAAVRCSRRGAWLLSSSAGPG